MINVSDAFKQKLQDGEKVWQEVEITFPDGTVKTVKDEIMSGNNSFSDCAESSSFPIGCVVCKSMTLELDNTSDQWKNYNFYMAKVHAYIKMQTQTASPAITDELLDEDYNPILDQNGKTILATKAAIDDRTETIDKGIYTITTPEQYGEILNFTALDDMYKANATYISNLILPQSVETLVRDACETLGIPSGVSMANGNLIVSELPENMTFRQLFGWAAMIETANARLDNKGYLQFIKWDFSNLQEDCSAVVDADGNVRFKGGASIDSENFVGPVGNWSIDNDGFLTLIESTADSTEKLKDFFESPTVSSDDIVVTGVKLKNKENESMYGNTGYVLELQNDLVSDADLDTVAAQIGDSIIGAKFRNMSGELACNPLIEFGDMAYTYDRKWNRYITPLTDVSCSVNGKTAVKTQADDPIRGQSKFQSDAAKAIVEARRLVKKESSAREEAVKKLEDTLKESSGLYETSVSQEDGSIITYLHDKPTLAESKNVIKFTAEAIGVSNDGGETYPYGFFLTGDLIAKILYAQGISADYINTGALTVKDDKGNIIFQVDIDTKTVRMSADIIQIGDKTLSAKITELENSIAQGVNISVTLSNDYQAIPVDANGNVIGDFPDVRTEVNAYYGTTDISSECSYTVTKSDNVSGDWDLDTHTYVVTGLTADSGWVDIRVTYLQTFSITQRFTVAKLYAGPAGESGTVYVLESSDTVIVRSNNGTYSPDMITFSAYSRKGDNNRQSYPGRFVIEETEDGKTWKTVYTSKTDESSVTDHLNNVLVYHKLNGFVTQNVALSDDNKNLLGVPREVSKVRCSLYAAGGTTTLIDRQTVPVVIEMDDLTQSDIIDILTNNGEWKGLYYLNGRLYISFDAARGGILKLGGKANGNGKLYWYDSFDNLVGNLDNEGILITNQDLEDSGYRIGRNGIEFIINSKTSGDVIITENGGIGIVDVDGKLAIDVTCDQLTADDGIINRLKVDKINSSNRDLEIGGSLTVDGYTILKKLDIDSTAKTLTVSTNGTVFKSSSSSKRYKDVGAIVSEEDIDAWYNIEPYWAKYKDGYLREGDENEGRYIPMFIAEDVAEHLPEASIHENGMVEDWNYRVMIPAMFAMIKQQHEEINNLQQIVKKLQGGE